jgi:hypothetical protein
METERNHAEQSVIAADLFRAVGHALTQWSTLEEALCTIYILCVCPHHKMSIAPAGAGFWAVPAFDSKLKMTNTAVRIWTRENASLDGQWNPLYNKLVAKGPKRNDLAHGTVATYWNGNLGQTSFVPSHYRKLYATDWARSDQPRVDPFTPEGSLSKTQIEERGASFTRLAGRLRTFRSVLSS